MWSTGVIIIFFLNKSCVAPNLADCLSEWTGHLSYLIKQTLARTAKREDKQAVGRDSSQIISVDITMGIVSGQ